MNTESHKDVAVEIGAHRHIPQEAGVITAEIAEALKEDILAEIMDELAEFVDAFNWVEWHIDAEKRTIRGTLQLPMLVREERG